MPNPVRARCRIKHAQGDSILLFFQNLHISASALAPLRKYNTAQYSAKSFVLVLLVIE